MSKNDDKKIIPININDNKFNISEDEAVLIVDGKKHDLDSFVISGRDKEGNTIVLTWEASMEEVLLYKEIMTVSIQNNLIEKLSEEE